MRVTVRFFASARDRAGVASAELELPGDAGVAELRAAIGARFPELAPHLEQTRLAVDLEFAGDETELVEGAEVAVIPPVSGG